MTKLVVTCVLISTAAWLLSSVAGYPADHREDTVLPFSLSPGNVNLEAYYLDKYPQPGVPGGPLIKKSTSQMTPSPLDPVPVPEAGGNTFLVHKTEDPHAMFRSRREANPQFGGYHYHHYPNGGGGGSMGFELHNEDNLHLHNYPRHGYPPVQEHQTNIHHHHHNHVSSHNHHHDHHQRHHTPPGHHYGHY